MNGPPTSVQNITAAAMRPSTTTAFPITAAAVLLLAVVPGCARPGARDTAQPRLRVLGTVQDGGLPHAACTCPRCDAAHRDARRRRFISSLAVLIPTAANRDAAYLVDATPDIREQIERLRDVRGAPSGRVDRAAVDGVFLTHAHIGHYLGLAFFGFEAVHTRQLPVWCTPHMAQFLKSNGPWSQLVRIGNIDVRESPPGQAVLLPAQGPAAQVSVTPIRVPHRDEYSDTVGFVFRRVTQAASQATPRSRGVFFVPDTEPWRTWQPGLPDVVQREEVDTLLVDGTFYSADELPGRAVSSIGHPLITDTMDLLEPLVRSKRLSVYFTHLNHSNPALEPGSAAAREISRRGFHVAGEGLEIGL